MLYKWRLISKACWCARYSASNVIASCLIAWCFLSGHADHTVACAADGRPGPQFRVLTWNIWHGGREDGDQLGPQRVADVIQESEADLIALQETYGSGKLIAERLGFHFHPRGTNVSILSRHPIVEDISVFEDFKCVGALIETPVGERVAFYSIWLPFNGDIWLPGNREQADISEWLSVCEPSDRDLKRIWSLIQDRLSGSEYEGVGIIVAGDFNSMSHLDYTAVNEDQFGNTVAWPTSQVLTSAGFRDAYREMHPLVDRHQDSTWTPRFPEQQQDRIDFVYYKASEWHCNEAEILRNHPDGFPSDHAAVLTSFRTGGNAPLSTAHAVRAATYNIRRGLGMDGKTDMKRTADAIRNLNADIVGLQEVDMNVGRSGLQNMMRELASRLQMHAAFAPFMPLDEGRYGIGLLSRYPIQQVRSVPLPEGNEPRVALAVEVLLPDGSTLTVVNIHFDWVSDDSFRWKQATALRDSLNEYDTPLLLIGDFNDRPGSRTLKMIQKNFREAEKVGMNKATWPANAPEREIDFLFVDRKHDWNLQGAVVAEESLASDHRPVVAVMSLTPSGSDGGKFRVAPDAPISESN
ncbi:endonuclease/exonuclease/phosphatase family protein [Aeoliella sp.]|uniref:endonuclease/exonuclease/phosphatase family protein n=1 Tax=Aeoliella sp. TaxID=2795800 RepID=UPI003CCBDA8E